MITGEQYCKSQGLDFSIWPKQNVPAEEFYKRNIPLVVACSNCTMTMTIGSSVIEKGCFYCSDCAEAITESLNQKLSESDIVQFFHSIKNIWVDDDNKLNMNLHHSGGELNRYHHVMRDNYSEGSFLDNLLKLIEDHLNENRK